jgi:hypothetical protein
VSRWLILSAFLVACSPGSMQSADDTGSGDDDGSGSGGAIGGDGCTTMDSDGDGWADEVERAMETSPTDASDNPDSHHQRTFVMPYSAHPHPMSYDLETVSVLARADLAILLDTTGSMAGMAAQIQPQLSAIITSLAGQVDDLAFGAAGFGDFPMYDGANSQYDVPFYLVHRVMTAHTPAGLAHIKNSFTVTNIIDGVGGSFAIMRGGDEPEQLWEALRQTAAGTGITYPSPYTGGTPISTPPFNAATAPPSTALAGEEIGTIGGLGFRKDALPIILQITDTNAHIGGDTHMTPVSATRQVARVALKAIGARVVGVMSYITVGEDDLTAMAMDTGGMVPPTAWGTGSERPAGCAVGKCCTVANDPDPLPQPDPVNGMCPLVFQSDRYSEHLAQIVSQSVVAIARGQKFQVAAELRDDPSDDVDVTQFVGSIDAIATGACSGEELTGNTFTGLVGGSPACFRITPKANQTVMPQAEAKRYRGLVQLTGDGVGGFTQQEVWFVVPTAECTPAIVL